MKIAYLDCFSGVSGDMFLGALLDAGLSIEELKHQLQTLPLGGYHIEVKREARNQIFGNRFQVILEKKETVSRNLEAIRGIIQQGELSNAVKDKSIEIFEALAGVEGKIHNRLPDEIHFHEVGAVDSIVDIVGTVYGIEHLGIRSLFVSPLPLGSGFSDTAHGRIPVPAPATISLLADIPVYDAGIPYEMVTPTGAALVKGLAGSFGRMPPMIVQNIGYGAGKRNLPDRPNLLRIIIGEGQSEQEGETIVIIETNLDDTNPEWLGYVMDRLYNAGALDVVLCPIQMKKNRPGVQVQVMGRPDQRDSLMAILFMETGTLGIRFRYSQRKVLKRSMAVVDSPFGKITVKKIEGVDGSLFLVPEYESCREIAVKKNRSLRDIYCWVMGLNRATTD
jgi:uncharacterized protein (TIGR00299 family) protein